MEIVRANHLGVAAGVAASDPATLDHCNVADAVFGGKVVSSRETVSSASNDDDVVAGFGIRIPQHRPPPAVTTKSLPDEIEKGIALHQRMDG